MRCIRLLSNTAETPEPAALAKQGQHELFEACTSGGIRATNGIRKTSRMHFEELPGSSSLLTLVVVLLLLTLARSDNL
jgi:hypothetical protein